MNGPWDPIEKSEPIVFSAALTDRDGSARDLNFVRPSWQGIATWFDHLSEDFGQIVGFQTDGQAFACTGLSDLHSRLENQNSVQLFCSEGMGLLSQLQVFLLAEPDKTPFIEVTFFPEDIRASTDLEPAFTSWARSLTQLFGASAYFCRLENASWTFGDVGPNSGVILSERLRR